MGWEFPHLRLMLISLAPLFSLLSGNGRRQLGHILGVVLQVTTSSHVGAIFRDRYKLQTGDAKI